MYKMTMKESFGERLWRHRGILFLIAVPLVLIGLILAGMPRAQQAFQFGSEQGTKYAVVIDAGSTGSRVHIFTFSTGSGMLELETDNFQQLKPGLSSYAESPKSAAESLKPLLDKALETVPANQQPHTSVEVRATAGLRLLPEGQADGILEAVRRYLKENYPFKCSRDSVSILDGADEGAFAWLTLNYLLGHLGGDVSNTVAAIDMGGGSVQMAYAVDRSTASKAPSKDYIYKLKGGGKVYNVYVKSQLGYGIMAGRAAVLEKAQDDGHYCLPHGFSGTYSYGGKELTAKHHAAGSSFDSCADVVTSALKVDEPCGKQGMCSFNGAWGGGLGHGADKVYVSSYLFDRGVDSGIVRDPEAIRWDATPAQYKEAAAEVCSLDEEAVKRKYPNVSPEHAPYLCMDLSYCYSVLVRGFKIKETAPVTMIKQIQYKGENLEAQWPLGAAINSLS
mmetsp:Transcript_32932/g.78154  ORF Transcript_32932/g.78154 Transcript_32932/m.78154 type:complete len:449 (+) Transcript_32932:117-1463(+)